MVGGVAWKLGGGGYNPLGVWINHWFYYRATLCVSAVFAVARCLSVCPSRLCILSTRLQISSNFSVGPVVHNSIFWSPVPVPNSKGTPSAGCKVQGVWENFAIFHWNRRLSRKRYEIGLWLQWNINRKSYALYRMVTFSMTFTDP